MITTPADQETQRAIDWYENGMARWRASGRRALRFVVRLALAVAAVASFMYVVGLIEGPR